MALGPFRYGGVVDHARNALTVGSRDVHVLPDGSGVFVEHVDPADEATFFDSTELLGCIEFINQEGSGFLEHHERFKTACRLDWNSRGVFEHFNIAQALAQGLPVNQLDGGNLLMVECQFRRLQTIEFGHSERAREAEANNYERKMSLEEQQAFAGTASGHADDLPGALPRLAEVLTQVMVALSLATSFRPPAGPAAGSFSDEVGAVSRSVRQRIGARAAVELNCDKAARSLCGMFCRAPQPGLGQGAPLFGLVSRAQREGSLPQRLLGSFAWRAGATWTLPSSDPIAP
ncbi:unnamed protein product, partial [Prorocentrum cordatum]